MSNASDFIIQDRMMINYELRNGVLTKYAGADKTVVIPENVTAIGQGAFAECKKVQSVTIPSSINFIADGAFEKCTVLKSVMIHDGALIIRDNAFGDNSFTECAPELTIHAPAGSYAETYAKENNIPFVAE